MFGGYTYMDSELTKAAVVVSGTPPVEQRQSSLQGLPLANTPKAFSASLFTTYRVLPRLTVGGGVYYVSRSKSLGGNQGGAGGGNPTASMRPNGPAWTPYAAYDLTDTRDACSLNVKNATRRANTSCAPTAFTTPIPRRRPCRPSLALNLRF